MKIAALLPFLELRQLDDHLATLFELFADYHQS